MLCQEESQIFQILFIPGIFCHLLGLELLSYPFLSSSWTSYEWWILWSYDFMFITDIFKEQCLLTVDIGVSLE